MTLTFIDSHCHFDFSDFDGDREAVWLQSQRLGVKRLVIPGVSPEHLAKTASQLLDGLYFAAGLHPWWVNEWLGKHPLNELSEMIQLATLNPRCIAVGECGLDAVITTPLAVQIPVFEQQLALASDLNLPVIIHSRKTHAEVLACIKRHRLARGGVIHAFSGSVEQAQAFWACGFYLGIGGTITYERARKTRSVAAQMPLESLLLETDAPDMPLSGYQGRRNSPEHIPAVAQVLAALRGQPLELIAAQTTRNAETLFNFSER